MDIGSAIAVFMVLSFLMLALFCFVTKYFHYKLKRTIEESNEVYSMVDEVYQNSEEEVDGQFQEYNVKSSPYKAKPEGNGDNDENYIEMSDIRAPLKQRQDDLYKPSTLRSKLNGGILQAMSKQESSREISSLKSFRPQKLITTNRTARSNKGQQGEPASTKHTFINKLVCYNNEGLTVYDILVKMIRKVSAGVVKENKTCKVHHYSTFQQNFDDQLEIMGFERNLFGCCKYQTSVQVSNMKTDQNYLVKSLKTSQSKQQISEEQYNRYRDELAQIARISE